MRMSIEKRCERSDNDYFRMGAAIAVGELYDMAAFGSFLEDEQGVRSYLESFGVRGLDDVDALHLKASRGPRDTVPGSPSDGARY